MRARSTWRKLGLALFASLSLFGGGGYGRWFGIIAASLTAIGALLEIPGYPLWSIAIFGLSLYVIHGLAVFGESVREPRTGT